MISGLQVINMSDGLSVVIPTRNEPLTWWTVRNLWAAADGVPIDVIVVDDGSTVDIRSINQMPQAASEKPDNCSIRIISDDSGPIGNCFRRDQGIIEAFYDAVLVLDAHCNMLPGVPADLLQWYEDDKTAISCAMSAQLSSYEERYEMSEAKGDPYVGAFVQPSQRTSTGEYRVMQGVWTRRPEVRQQLATGAAVDVGCLMGGAYLMSRANYISGLCRPWRHNRGWGTSEPVIAIAQAALGLAIRVIPVVIGHDYRSGKQYLVPYRVPPVHHMIANQLLAAAMMYSVDSGEFDGALNHVRKSHKSLGIETAALKELESNGGLEYAAKINRVRAPEQLQQWMADWAAREPVKT